MTIEFSGLKIFRKQSGFTQEEIAEKLDVSHQTVAKWEHRGTLPANCRKIFGFKEGDNILVLGDEEKDITLMNLSNISGNRDKEVKQNESS